MGFVRATCRMKRRTELGCQPPVVEPELGHVAATKAIRVVLEQDDQPRREIAGRSAPSEQGKQEWAVTANIYR